MNDGLALVFAFAAGMLLGGVFFGGLWWTVRKCVATPYPARWMMGSALARMSITLAGFYFVSDGQIKPLLACLVGFIAARLIVTRSTRPVTGSGRGNESHAEGLVTSSTTSGDHHAT